MKYTLIALLLILTGCGTIELEVTPENKCPKPVIYHPDTLVAVIEDKQIQTTYNF